MDFFRKQKHAPRILPAKPCEYCKKLFSPKVYKNKLRADIWRPRRFCSIKCARRDKGWRETISKMAKIREERARKTRHTVRWTRRNPYAWWEEIHFKYRVYSKLDALKHVERLQKDPSVLNIKLIYPKAQQPDPKVAQHMVQDYKKHVAKVAGMT